MDCLMRLQLLMALVFIWTCEAEVYESISYDRRRLGNKILEKHFTTPSGQNKLECCEFDTTYVKCMVTLYKKNEQGGYTTLKTHGCDKCENIETFIQADGDKYIVHTTNGPFLTKVTLNEADRLNRVWNLGLFIRPQQTQQTLLPQHIPGSSSQGNQGLPLFPQEPDLREDQSKAYTENETGSKSSQSKKIQHKRKAEEDPQNSESNKSRRKTENFFPETPGDLKQ